MIPENYTCDGQMNIWELFRPEEKLPELEEIVSICEARQRRNFKKRERDGRPEYFDKYKKSEICLYESHFS